MDRIVQIFITIYQNIVIYKRNNNYYNFQVFEWKNKYVYAFIFDIFKNLTKIE